MIWNWNFDMKLTLLSDDLELEFGYKIDLTFWWFGTEIRIKMTTGMKKYNYDNMIMFSDYVFLIWYDMICIFQN